MLKQRSDPPPSDDSVGGAGVELSLASFWPFLLMTFGITWAVLGAYMALPEQMAGWVGALTGEHPLFYLAVYAPAIAAVVVIMARGGVGAVGRFLSRVLLWRCAVGWYVFVVVGVPAVFYLGSAMKGTLSDPLAVSSLGGWLMASAMMLIKGAVEEFGWRGFALPLLQRRLAPFWAGLLLGIIWGLWHLPAFLLSGTPQSAWSFTPFFIGSVALSVIVTPLFNRSRGSILLPVLFHFQLINPLWPDAQPYDTWLFVAAAAVIVWLNRRTMFTRGSACRDIVPS